ncbi:CAAD domain-containing protein [Prochlorococcus sp. MIT 1307]|uniref:CAAD domain-containing protein n=1 Tax=Prochlorococcus sp. MIT 1307 TaxID=3096219 RepID=UPI002A75C489|nr:CAAD domain-containing protein [Prochlorococcus sp. MIT 1307]
MSSVKRSNSRNKKDFPSHTENTSEIGLSNSKRSSTSDKPDQYQNPADANEVLAIEKSAASSEIQSGFDIGNELESLLSKLRGWIGLKTNSKEFDLFLDPSLVLLGLIALLVFFKAYTGVLESFEKIPLAPSFCQVLGTIWLTKFSIKRLLRKQERQQFLLKAKKRWQTFSGQNEKNS